MVKEVPPTFATRSCLVSLSIRAVGPTPSLDEHVCLDALARVLPPTTVTAVVAAEGVREQRRRKLPASLVVVFCIAMNLYASEALSHVFTRLLRGLRWLWPDPTALRVSKAGLCQARYRLGARPLAALFHQVCHPLAQPTTPGAFAFGLRLMAIDAEVLDLPDTPANDRVYGRAITARGASAWPQAQLVGLCECGTHAIVDAGLWPYRADLHRAARRLLRSVTPGMLLSWDQGLHSFALIAATRQRRAHVLSRLPPGARPEVVATLGDGTQLVRIRPRDARARRWGDQVLVRLLRYTLDDPNRPGHQVEHRLVTSLINPVRFPAEELILAYHARWEYELTIDELETHQRPRLPLRSQKPVGVVQEVYGLLLAHYLVRAVMVEAAATRDLAPTRVSFLSALRLIREFLPDFQRTAPVDHPVLYQALLADIAAATLPPRANRINPRVVKRKMSSFPVKRASHRHWPQPTKSFRDAIVLLK
jgi:hypothetical protein